MAHHFTRLTAPAVLLAGLAVAVTAPAGSAQATPVTCRGEVATMVGTSGPDHLVGTSGPDVIAGLEGHDTIDAKGGDDVVCGGPGWDVLVGGDGDDRLLGGRDQYGGDQGGEYLRGDRLRGGPGDDHLDVGYDPRSERIPHRTGDAVDFIDATAGVDVDLDVADGEDGRATGDGTDTITITRSMSVHGSDSDDLVIGTMRRDIVVGRDGDDEILTRGGDDVITADRLDGGTGDDVVRGGNGDDLISSHGGHDQLFGGNGDEWLFAYSSLSGTVQGGPGDDVVEHHLTTDPGLVSHGGAGFDHVALYGDALEGASPRTTLTVDLRDGTVTSDDEPTVTGAIGDYEEYRFVGDLTWEFHGSPGADRVWLAAGGTLSAWTYAGRDWLMGNTGDDLLDAGAGRDEVHGGGGDDTCRHFEKGGC